MVVNLFVLLVHLKLINFQIHNSYQIIRRRNNNQQPIIYAPEIWNQITQEI